MSDLIDRQKVLNTLDNADKFLDEERTVEKYKELLTECIKVLPSAENKGDLISRQAALNALKEHRSLFCDNTPETFSKLSYAEKSRVDELDTAIATIVNLPSVENKGEWIKIQSGDKDFPESIVCSKCKNENSHLDFNEHGEPIGKVFVTSKFCPNCGADMRGET